LMLWTRQDGNRAGLDWDHSWVWSLWAEPATGTPDPTRWRVIQKVSSVLGRQSTDRREVSQMIITPHHGDCELIQQQE